MKRFLFLVLTVTLMIFVSYNVFAEEADGPFPAGRSTDWAPQETNPFAAQAAANEHGAVQTAIVKQGSATSENQVFCADCPQSNLPIRRNANTGTKNQTPILGPDGKPVGTDQ